MPSKLKKQKKSSKHTKKSSKPTPEQRERRRRLKASRARRKELAKLLRKKSRQHGPNPYSAARFHKGYVYDPIRYTVLTASQMPRDKIEMVTSRLKTVTTGTEAMTLPDGHSGWRTIEIGTLGRCYLVDYCGIEVALFFKRQLTEIVPEPGEKAPECVLQDPKEAWQRLDLLGRSAEKSNFVLTQAQRRLEEVNKLLTERITGLDDLNDQLKVKLVDKDQQIHNLEIQKAAFEKQLRELKKVTFGFRFGAGVPKSISKLQTSGKSKGNRGKQYRSNTAFLKAQRKLKHKSK